MSDLRLAARSLAKQPGFCATAILTLALGIGANIAIFSIFDAVLLRPLPYPDSARLALVWQKRPNGQRNAVSAANFLEWVKQVQCFERLAAINVQAFNVAGREDVLQITGAQVSAGFFATLGVRPALGREFSSDEDGFHNPRVALLSHGFWQAELGGDSSALQRTLNINGQPHAIIGVLPRDFEFAVLKGIQVWTPMQFDNRVSLHANNLAVIGRLKPGIGAAAADREMQIVAKRLESQLPATNTGWSALVTPMQDYVTGDVRPALLALLGAVGFVLLIACVNVANLLLARSETRQHEIAIRAALGAGRMRLARQLLSEALLLSAAGCVLGLALARGALLLVVRFDAGRLPRSDTIGLNGHALAFAILVTLLTALIFGLFPAYQLLRVDLHLILREAGRAAAGRSTAGWSRNLLMVSEIAFSVLLLIGAGLMLRSFLWLENENRGFRPEQLLSFRVSFLSAAPLERLQLAAQYREMLDKIGGIPGVRAVGAITNLPLEGYRQLGGYFQIAGGPPPSPTDRPSAASDLVNAGYFRLMQIPIVQGRGFDERDREDAPRVVIVSEALAKRYFAGQNPIGRRLIVGDPGRSGSPVPREIVGVASDVHYPTLTAADSVEMYLPYVQTTWPINYVLVRTDRDARALAPAVRAALHGSFGRQPISEILTMSERIAAVNGRPRWNSLLAAAFAGIALALASVGIYGVVSYSTAQRTREIGVRMAVGATHRDIVLWIVRQALWLALAGLGLGLAGHLALSRLLRALVYGTSVNDWSTLLGAAALLGLIAVIASYVPARRAVNSDPMSALRAE